MTNKTTRQIPYIVFLLLSTLFVSASVEDYVASLSFDYSSGQINVTNFSDALIDSDIDGLNDTLMINLTTAGTAGNYTFIVDIEDPQTIISNSVVKNVSAADTVLLNFSTTLFTQDVYNYTVRVYNSSNVSIYRKDKTQTGTLENYDGGTNISDISDQNVDNNIIRVTINLSVTENETTNITAFLRHNESYISATTEAYLTTPEQTVNLDFDNETIKSTHYTGQYLIDYVKIGEKLVDIDQNTSSYDFKTFAKTSYIKEFSSAAQDTNANNLSEHLEINVTANITTADTYTITLGVYDLYDNYIANISKTDSLSTGDQTVQMQINGSDIYASKTDGPYTVAYAKLIKDDNTTATDSAWIDITVS